MEEEFLHNPGMPCCPKFVRAQRVLCGPIRPRVQAMCLVAKATLTQQHLSTSCQNHQGLLPSGGTSVAMRGWSGALVKW